MADDRQPVRDGSKRPKGATGHLRDYPQILDDIRATSYEYNRNVYSVCRQPGTEWPPTWALIDIADPVTGSYVGHFGGVVFETDDEDVREVHVYTD